jgi:signal transduction histidine kinase
MHMFTLNDPGYEFWRRYSNGLDCSSDHPILARWQRVRELRAIAERAGIAPRSDLGAAERQERTRNRFGRAYDLLRASSEEFRRRGCGFFLVDQDGTMLLAHGLDTFADPVLRDFFREGQHWDETARGTNAMGTVLAEDAALAVIGRAHHDTRWHDLVCYGAPVHDVDGRLVAALDVTGPLRAADPLMGLTVEGLASAVEGLLRAKAIEDLALRIDTLETERTVARADREGLAETLRMNEMLLAAVGHDLRDPLSAIMMSASILKQDGRLAKLGDLIHASGRRMMAMVDQLLDLTRCRLDGGIRLVTGIPVDLAALVARIIDEIRASKADCTIVLDKTGDASGAWDAARLEQVVANLVGNAVRHGVPGRPIRVGVDGRRTDAVELAVSNGGEIDPAILPHIFEPFRSAGSKRTGSQGLGLGLYIVQQIVVSHRGEIKVDTKDGTTTFRVSLPRRAA